VAEEGCAIAAILAEGRDLFTRSFERARGQWAVDDAPRDVLVRLERLREVIGDGEVDRDRCRRNDLDAGVATSIDRVRRQLARASDRSKQPKGEVDDLLRMAILAGYPDRVAKRRAGAEGRMGSSNEVVLCNGGSATLAETSVVQTAPWLVAVDARDDARGRARVWLASAIEPEWLIDLAPDRVRETIDVSFREDLERVETVERMLYERLVLDERPAGAASDDAATELLVARALAKGIDTFFPDDALFSLRTRIGFLVENAPDLAERAGLHLLDDEAVRRILVDRCRGKRSFAELRAEPLLEEIRETIGRGALARLDTLAPDHVTLRGGRRVRVAYTQGQPPSIESRLQDFFGSTDGPRILDGRVPLVLHLLAPNGRDVQVTTDLAGFWARTYPALRNELSRRYPRHSWPTEPQTAAPPAPSGRRR
jgi:ATP-dependent helicase HrpB